MNGRFAFIQLSEDMIHTILLSLKEHIDSVWFSSGNIEYISRMKEFFVGELAMPFRSKYAPINSKTIKFLYVTTKKYFLLRWL